MSKKIAPFTASVSLSDNFSENNIKQDIALIANPEGLVGKDLKGHKAHNAAIYAGTESLGAFIGDGRVVTENLAKEMIVPARGKKNSFNVIAFTMGHIKEMCEKFPSEEFSYSLVGRVQMLHKIVEIKKPVEISYKPKARTFKKSCGISGEVLVNGTIDSMAYAFVPELQEMGMKIKISKK